MKIGVIDGSVRQGRNSAKVAAWVVSSAPEISDVEIVPLAIIDYDLPFVDSEIPPAGLGKNYPHATVQAWADAMGACDAFIFVTPEYNHGVPGALKNAVDWLGAELIGKPAALVSYGSDGGVRAVEQWRQILANFNMYVVRGTVSLNLFTEFPDGIFTPGERRADAIAEVYAQLLTAAGVKLVSGQQ